jgi:hypothetical protein
VGRLHDEKSLTRHPGRNDNPCVQHAPTRLFLHLHPGDAALAAILALSVVVAAVRLPSAGTPLLGLFLVQVGLLVGFLLCVRWWSRREQRPIVSFLRPAVTASIVFTCYTTLGLLGVAAMPYLADSALSRADTALCGVDPSLWLQRFLTPGRVEFFSFVYGAFIPYVYLSIVLGCLGRPPLERDQFLTGWVFTYAISYLGYLFLPGHGPVVYHAADYAVALEGSFFYDLVVRGVAASGGLQGVFPSLHVGASVYLCLFDLQTNRLRGLTYLPLVLLIYAATLVLRYHYVVDLIAGTLIPAACIPLGRRAFLRWARARQAAHLPALPGGEGDDLSAISDAGESDLAPLLSRH